jgi:Oligosaccharide biosynthesis protein Alg14 like
MRPAAAFPQKERARVASPRRVLAVASGGGHWIQLRRLRPAWAGCAVTYVTTRPGYRDEVAREVGEMTGDAGEGGGPAPRFLTVPDANRWQKLRLVRQLAAIAWIVLRTRPHAIVTTGAAPGYFAIRIGRLLGARTVWVDSIANAEELSLSGRQAGPHADLWLTQWEHLALPKGAAPAARGPHYRGAVL